ncbi:transcriptional regulator [Amycolatopsis sp. lyj-346]|uniref:transcriptional regulator n=1 Tax=Amycolatopsis sp. lyj-346 TaxID=2789289 RepID=UPI0039781FE9
MALVLLSGLCAGLPWALVRFIGWPLPDHLPTMAELGEVLTAQLSTGLLLDVLACGAWLLWGAFLVELARCGRDLVRTAGRPDSVWRGSPLRRVAAVLITTVVVSFVSRTALAASGVSGAIQTGVSSSVTAPLAVDDRSEDVELVRSPREGVHDSLYRIAQRCLGDGNRWPELWRLNAGSTQPGGRTLISPRLIHSGDRIRLPSTPMPAASIPPQRQPPPAKPMATSPPSPSPPLTVARGPSSSWELGVYVGLGLAGAVSAMLVVARRRHRAGYRPGSGRRDDDLPVAPVVYQLHLAHQHAQTGPDEAHAGEADEEGGAAEPEAMLALGEPADAVAADLALDLAATHGLGLIGPGSPAAARALLLTAMATTRHPQIVAPAADLRGLLGVPEHGTDLPECVHVVDDFAAALTHLDSQIPRDSAVRILLASAPAVEPDRTRLQYALAGRGTSTTVLLLGQWHPGVTAYVDTAGTLTATSPGPGERLRGRLAFSLPESATRELFALFDAAHGARDDHVEPAVEPSHGLEIAGPPDQVDVPEPDSTNAAEAQRDVAAPLVLTVFGQPRLSWRPDLARPERAVEVTGSLSRRLWELLIYLSLHPEGVPRAAIIDSMWANRPAQDPAAVLRTVLSRLRSTVHKATSPDIGDLVVAQHGRYRLEPAVVEVDYWTFAGALARRRTTTDEQHRVAANAAIVASYGGELAAGVEVDWLTALREGVRRDALDAVAALARGRVRSDPESTLELLESARDFDPHNELLYRDIMRLEHNLGRHDAIARTLRLLEARLAEIDETPTAATIELAERLREPHAGIAIPKA